MIVGDLLYQSLVIAVNIQEIGSSDQTTGYGISL